MSPKSRNPKIKLNTFNFPHKHNIKNSNKASRQRAPKVPTKQLHATKKQPKTQKMEEIDQSVNNDSTVSIYVRIKPLSKKERKKRKVGLPHPHQRP